MSWMGKAFPTGVRGSIVNEEHRFDRLRLYNLVMGLFHLVQGIAIVALSNDFKLPVTASFLAGPPGTPPATPEILFECPLVLLSPRLSSAVQEDRSVAVRKHPDAHVAVATA